MRAPQNQLKIGIVLNYVNMILGNLIPIFYTPIMLDLLGQSEYGLYKLSSNVTSYLTLISLGLGSAISRYLIKAREEEGQEAEERILGLFHVIFQIIAVIVLIVGIILTFCLDFWYAESLTTHELFRMKILVFIMVINMAVGLSGSSFNSAISSHERFVFLQCMNILTTCIGPLLNLLMLYFGYASIGMTIASLTIAVIVRVLYEIYARCALQLKPRYKKMPKGLLKEIFVFSFWVFVANIVGQLYNATDTVLIGAVPALATAGVAIYNIGGTLSNIVFNVTIGISSLLSPKTQKMVFSGASNTELTDLAIRVGRLQGMVFTLVVSGFIAFGQPFIHYYAGEGYEDAYWVAVLMMVPNMIPLVQSVCLSIVVARNQHRFRSLVYLGIAVLNVVATWLVLPYWGIIGAALMTGIALVIGQGFVMNWYYWKKTGLEIGRFWKEVCKVYVIPVLLCVITVVLSKWIDFYIIPIFIAGIVLYAAAYFVLSWLFVMNDYEKDLIRTPIRKLFKRG